LHRLTIAAISVALTLAAPISAETIGICQFDRETLTFAGSPAQQATCLLRKVELLGEIEPQPLPPVMQRLLDSGEAPSAAHKVAAIAALPQPYRSYAAQHQHREVSQTAAGLPLLYFVIHDTSTPFYAKDRFPKRLDSDLKVNDFTPYMDGTFAPDPVAHIFLNRQGQIWAGHDFSEGWRATKLESQVIGVPARGRFTHIELVQPRRFLPGYSDREHTQGPVPGFSDAQYRQLAALYVYASARAGHWLIPAFHATLDEGILDGHDDPQNFELEKFGLALERLVNPPQRPLC
jgi:N-acetylmuramoyl-L-alanine amidase